MGSGKFEEIMVASQEVAASTAQLVIASRVKARQGSHKFHELRLASKLVTEATGAVVAVAKSSSVTAESKLRPSGRAGLLYNSPSSFQMQTWTSLDYQRIKPKHWR